MKRRLLILFVLLSVLTSLLAACRSESSTATVTTDTDGISETPAATEAAPTTAEDETDSPETEESVYFPPYEGGEVVLRFILSSDTHITSASPVSQSSFLPAV